MLKCRLLEMGPGWTRLGVVGVEAERDGQREATLALACIRKDAYEQAVAQCTELGVSRFVPFTYEKAGIKGYNPTFIDRLKRIAIASMKQSFRFTLPDIDEPIPFEGLAAHIEASRQIFVGEQHAARPRALKAASPLLLIIGPEGGFAEGERACLERLGCSFVSAGRNRLRSETAAVALASLVLSGSEEA
jgi:16S rRNA (uracil1498-N3)-methyltransferase